VDGTDTDCEEREPEEKKRLFPVCWRNNDVMRSIPTAKILVTILLLVLVEGTVFLFRRCFLIGI
jgi:hypothetical protein